MMRTYTELISIPTFDERLEYCALRGRVSELTFGDNRYLNQALYQSYEWRNFRRDIIIRDHGCDLAMDGHELNSLIYIHHLNPIEVEDVLEHKSRVFDPENVVCVSFLTHQYIHYGIPGTDKKFRVAERSENDTIPWR